MLYFLAALPSIALTIAGLLFGVFPLDKAKAAARWSIAVATIVIGILSGVVSAFQASGQDAKIASLSAGQATAQSGINDLEQHSPRIPRLQVHSDGDVYLQRVGFNAWSVELALTITNDGDDLSFSNHYWTQISETTNDLGRQAVFAGLRKKLTYLGEDPDTLPHGSNKAIWLISTVKSAEYNNLMLAKMTMYFYERFDARTVTGKKETRWFCGYYQGGPLQLCRDNTL